MTTAILMLINTPMSKALTFMTLTMIMTTISITTHSNTRVMWNIPVTIMKEEFKNLLNAIMKTTVLNTMRRRKVAYVKRMRQTHSLMMVLNNDMRINLSKFT